MPDVALPRQLHAIGRRALTEARARRASSVGAEHVLLAIAADKPFGTIPLATHRAPVRPLPLKLLADWGESEGMRAGWDVWFGIPTAWIPYRDIGTTRETAHQAADVWRA